MLGANLASSGLFAAESAVDFSNLGPYLPYVVGGVFTLAVVVVGLVLSRKSGSAEQPVAEDFSEEQKPDGYLAPNPLWKLILPGVAVLALGAGIIFFVVPLAQDLLKAREKSREATEGSIRAKYDETMKAILSQNPQIPPMGTPVQFQPIQFPQPQIQFPQPQIQIPKFTPTPPRIPQVYVDSKGIVRTR